MLAINLLICCAILCCNMVDVDSKLLLKKIVDCVDDSPYHYDLDLKFLNESYLDISVNYSSKMYLGPGQKTRTEAWTLVGSKWVKLISLLSSGDACHELEIYLPKLMHDMQRAGGMKLGCPLQRGNYTIKHFKLAVSNKDYKSMPHGMMRLKSTVLDVKTNKIMFCVLTEVQNAN